MSYITPPLSPEPLFHPSSLKRKTEDLEQNPTKKSKSSLQPKFLPFGAYSRPNNTSNKTGRIFARTSRSLIPPAPGKHLKRKIDLTKFFEGNQLTIETDINPINIGLEIDTNNIYKDKEVIRNVFKQPEKSTSCSAYCLAMLASDLFRENPERHQLDWTFQDWMDKAALLKSDQVVSWAKRYNIPLEKTIIKEDHINQLREKLQKSKHSLIVSIDHLKIDGHDIVIDSISDTHTTLRDPYTGRAWKISNEELEKHLTNEDCPQSCLSLSTDAN